MVYIKSKKYHIHHWVSVPAMYIPLAFYTDIFRAQQLFFHGLVIGAVVQGLRYKDRFKFIRSEKEIQEYLLPKA